jgi:hypothetical protein
MLILRLENAGVDQLCVADSAYIRLEEELVHLAVTLDAYSLPRDRVEPGSDARGFPHAERVADGVEAASRKGNPFDNAQCGSFLKTLQ